MSRAIAVLLFLLSFLPLGFSEEEAAPKNASSSGAGTLDNETISEMERMRKEPRISSDFSRGSFLIYDCRNRNYACVNEPSFARCRKLRDDGYKNRKMVLPCAPLKRFENQKECFDKHYSLIHRQKSKGFCQNTKNSKY